MCALSGMLKIGGGIVDLTLLEKISSSMRSRGPDGHAAVNFGACGLAHERLAIIDVAGGRQPLLNEDGRLAVIVNGEIYNYRELRRDLLARGHRFSSESDSEVVVHGYEEYGNAVFARLHGMFALALWDDRTQTLILARDGLGKKPLAYTWLNPTSLLFASDVRAFNVHPQFRARLRDAGIAEYLGYRCVADPGSIYQDVHKVPAGEWLAIHADGATSRGVHWNLPAAETQIAFDRRLEPALCEELRSLVRASVERRLMSDVPLGVLLSGGIDSTIIAYEAAQLHPDVQTFTLGFAGINDEREVARATATALGTRHRDLRIELQPRQAIEDAEAAYDEPFADSSSVASVRICRAAKEQVGVVLNGDGGDEAFAGYPRSRLLMEMSNGTADTSSLLALKLRAKLGRKATRQRAKEIILGRSVCENYQPPFQRWRALLWIFSPAEVARLMGNRAPSTLWLDECSFAAAEGDDYRAYLRNDLLVKMDRASMHCGLEARSPLLDTDVIRFIRTLSPQWKLANGGGKYLLRAAYAGRLPGHIWNLPKRGFASPTKRWLKRELQAEVRELAGDREQPIYRHLDYEQVQAITHKLQSQHKQVWTLLVLNRWLLQNSKQLG
ncbi:MAG: hypothetical protein JWR16_3631 [Nevskia sp.]|nr:hypothetical protein [Nevskia sp.]